MNNYDSLASLEDLKAEFLEFDSGYIADIIQEVADNNIDIYNYDLLNSAWDLYSSGAYDDAMSEFGTSNDMIKDFQMAQYMFYSNLMYENLDELVGDFVVNYVRLHFTDNDDVIDEVLNSIDEVDNNDTLESIIEQITEYFENEEEEKEEC